MWSKYLLSLLAIFMLVAPGSAQHSPCNNPAWTDSAITHIQQGYSYTTQEWQLACDSLLAICPGLDQVWQMKSMPNIKAGNWEAAYAPLQKAVALNPQEWLPYQAFLKCIFSKDYEAALPEFEQCEKMISGAGVMDHSFDFFRGLCYLGLDSQARAILFLQKDISDQVRRRGKNNVHHVSLLYLGVAQWKAGRTLDAELTLRQCLGIYPQYPEANFYLGAVYAQTGKKVLAKACFLKSRQYLLEGYNSSEDQEFYVNYPFAIGNTDIDEALNKLKY